MTALPPAASIAFCAAFENLCACTVTADFSSPFASTFTRPLRFFRMPCSVSFSSVNSLSFSSAIVSRPSTAYSTRKMFVKPRLGRRRCSGIWPPSKPRIRLEPERDPWPLWPRVEVLPMPEPIPRPTRFLFSFAFFGAFRLERFSAMISSLTPDASQEASDSHVVASDSRRNRTSRRLGPGAEPSPPCRESTVCLRARRSGCSRVKPRPLITSLCLTGVQILRAEVLQLDLVFACHCSSPFEYRRSTTRTL